VVVSGGQTGVDRAALDAALAAGVPCGGWCPRGRAAEDGEIPARYPLRETPSAESPQRTEWNVRDADATLVLVRGEPQGGTALALRCAARLGKPHLVVDLEGLPDPAARIRDFLAERPRGILNVAGPRESECPGIGAEAHALLAALLRERADGDTR